MPPERLSSEMRFRLLETLREYGAEQLAPEEQAAVARRHAAYYVELAEQAEVGMRGPEQRWWLDRLEQEQDNLRAALDWAVASGAGCATDEGARSEGPDPGQPGLRLVAALTRFWYVRGYGAEGQARWAALQSLPGASERTPARAKALCRSGLLSRMKGDHLAGRAAAAEALAIAQELNDPYGVALALEEQS